MKIFHKINSLGEFRRQHLPFVKTLEDMDLLREIGIHQEKGDPITLKLLFLREIGSVATVQRRLSRLKRLGVVNQERATHDKRIVKLTLAPALMRKYRKLIALFK
jgi:DNA-binding MarR family transcriptional regulator